jgi:hypothetical protein
MPSWTVIGTDVFGTYVYSEQELVTGFNAYIVAHSYPKNNDPDSRSFLSSQVWHPRT